MTSPSPNHNTHKTQTKTTTPTTQACCPTSGSELAAAAAAAAAAEGGDASATFFISSRSSKALAPRSLRSTSAAQHNTHVSSKGGPTTHASRQALQHTAALPPAHCCCLLGQPFTHQPHASGSPTHPQHQCPPAPVGVCRVAAQRRLGHRQQRLGLGAGAGLQAADAHQHLPNRV